MIEINDGRMIHLKGKNTSYVFRITDTDHLEHIHYGKRLEHAQEDGRAIIDKNRSRAGLSIALDSNHPTLDLNNMALEASFEGKGDFKSPLVKIEGRKTLDLRYSGHRLYPGIKRYRSASLPMAVAEEENAETVEILLKDEEQKISVILCYTLFKDWDIISRKTIVRNDGKEEIVIGKCASMQLDLYGSSFSLTSLGGAWLRELEVKKQSLCSGTLSLSSRNMSTGFETNSAFAIEDERGGCLICALVYSSSFSTTFEMGEQSRLHIVSGINSENFKWSLNPEEEFESPESIMCFSEKGLADASLRFRKGIEKVIMRGPWKERLRPLMLSTRDIMGLDVSESRIYELSAAAKAMGFEGIIVDDGWFGVRRERNTSLGDWYVNSLKFPSGLKMVASNIHREGLLFGLYFDIETVSRNSNLFESKPEWAVRDKKVKTYSSNEEDYLLDFTLAEVQEWATDTISEIIETAKLDYLRYEKTRLPSEICSSYPDEFEHRYIMGVYSVLNAISRKYPNLLIETSFSGGGRFDLGMLSYSSLMRITDNTDPISRIKSVEGAGLFYPQKAGLVTISSSPDKCTGKQIDIETRFNASLFTPVEYSLDLTVLMPHEALAISKEIEFYKHYRHVLQFGNIIREESGERVIWSASDDDASTIIILYLIKEFPLNRAKERIFVRQANENYKYRIYSRTHVQREDEALTSPMEIESYEAWGDSIKWAGIALTDRSGGYFGYQEDMRKLKDNSSRLYIIRKI